MRPVEPHACDLGPPRERGKAALTSTVHLGPGKATVCEYILGVTYCGRPALRAPFLTTVAKNQPRSGQDSGEFSLNLEIEKIQALPCRDL